MGSGNGLGLGNVPVWVWANGHVSVAWCVWVWWCSCGCDEVHMGVMKFGTDSMMITQDWDGVWSANVTRVLWAVKIMPLWPFHGLSLVKGVCALHHSTRAQASEGFRLGFSLCTSPTHYCHVWVLMWLGVHVLAFGCFTVPGYRFGIQGC